MTRLKIGIVGSGPTAVAAATALVSSPHEVEMLDFGNEPGPAAQQLASRLKTGAATETDERLLKEGIPDELVQRRHSPLWNFLHGKAAPDAFWKKQFGSKFTFKDTEEYIPLRNEALHVPRSLAKGGLTNVWGAACYPFTAREFTGWPISESDMAEHFTAAARILGISQKPDGLHEHYPIYNPSLSVLKLNPQAESLLGHWQQHQAALNRRGFYFGHARLAVLTEPRDGRLGCQYTGLCLYGCPVGAIYNAAFTVDELKRQRTFRYSPGYFVRSFSESASGKVTVRAREVKSGAMREFEFDRLILAGGALSSLQIVCESLNEYSRTVRVLDNYLVMLPLTRTRQWQDFTNEVKFTLSQLVLLVDNSDLCDARIHTQLYSYSDYIFGRFAPVVNLVPLPFRRLIYKWFYNTFIQFIYLNDKNSPPASVRVIRQSGDKPAILDLQRGDTGPAEALIKRLLSDFWRHREALGLIPITPALRKSEVGFSAHLAGSIPMRKTPSALETNANGCLYGCKSVYVVDQSALPTLGAQNSTFTAMANAHRIATQLTRELSL